MSELQAQMTTTVQMAVQKTQLLQQKLVQAMERNQELENQLQQRPAK